jgi:hypothetical protein
LPIRGPNNINIVDTQHQGIEKERRKTMSLASKSGDETYIFWLFNWSNKPVQTHMRLVPNYQRCDITKESITIHDEGSTVVIPLSDIKTYDRQRVYEYTYNLKLSLVHGISQAGKYRRQTKQFFLLTADVFSHVAEDNWELKNMYEVIRCLKNGEESTVDPNPYHRMLRRRGQTERLTERVWDPFLHPNHYGRVPTTLSIFARMILILFGVSVFGAFVAGATYYIVTTFF